MEVKRRGCTPPVPGGFGCKAAREEARCGRREEASGGGKEREGAQNPRRLHQEAVAVLISSTAVSPATQRRGESPRKVSLGVTVTTAQKPPDK